MRGTQEEEGRQNVAPLCILRCTGVYTDSGPRIRFALDEQVEVRCEVWMDRVRRHDGGLVVNGTG